MVGQPELKLNLKNVSPHALVTDLVYNPKDTNLLKLAKSFGYNTVDGLGMLLYQAELGFSNWFNHKPDVTDELKAVMTQQDLKG